MEKINFIDNVTKGNAETFNTIQDNIENAFKPYILYDNATGTETTLTLSDSSENYSYIEIFFNRDNKGFSSVKVYNPNGKDVNLGMQYMLNNIYRIYASIINISEASISFTSNMYINIIASGVSEVGNVSNIKIHRVVGYKEGGNE